MVRKYGVKEALAGTPRVIISMNIYGGGLEHGYNQHYSLDTLLPEALADFFQQMPCDNPDCHIDLKRSKLEIYYQDLPKQAEVVLTKEDSHE